MTEIAFPAGTFTPDPRPNAVPRMLAAQFALELKLLLRNGEQLLLTMFIPITLLVGLTLLPLGSFGYNRAATFVPVIMALAVISTAFTGQAIAVAFDRRYGALKRLGATALPVWGIIAGKSLAVVTVVFLQAIISGRHRFCAWLAAASGGLGVGRGGHRAGHRGFRRAGAAAGRHAAGRDRAGGGQPDVVRLRRARRADAGHRHGRGPVKWAARLTPVGRADRGAVAGDELSVDWFGVAVLAAWGGLAGLAALRWFRFT